MAPSSRVQRQRRLDLAQQAPRTAPKQLARGAGGRPDSGQGQHLTGSGRGHKHPGAQDSGDGVRGHGNYQPRTVSNTPAGFAYIFSGSSYNHHPGFTDEEIRLENTKWLGWLHSVAVSTAALHTEGPGFALQAEPRTIPHVRQAPQVHAASMCEGTPRLQRSSS